MIPITFVRKNPGWLSDALPHAQFQPPAVAALSLIEARAAMTHQAGEQPLWEGYQHVKDYKRGGSTTRLPDQVRTHQASGLFYAWLASSRRSQVVVEFGTAFGVSGMFWLAGLCASGGVLFTFEPNPVWAEMALGNLRAISPDFRLTLGTFEEHAASVLGGKDVDICFIDAIHTREFVTRQYAIARRYMKAGALVLFDDIRFSPDMLACWTDIANAADVVSSAEIGRRVGIVELG